MSVFSDEQMHRPLFEEPTREIERQNASEGPFGFLIGGGANLPPQHLAQQYFDAAYLLTETIRNGDFEDYRLANPVLYLYRHEEWMVFLNSSRQEALQEEIKKSKRDDGFVDALLFTQFCDKKEILIRAFRFGQSKTKLRDQLDKVQTLRDNVAHANEYAATPEQARNVCAVVRDLLPLREKIAGTGQAL